MDDPHTKALQRAVAELAQSCRANADALQAIAAANQATANTLNVLHDAATGAINGSTIMLAMLADQLDARGVLPKSEFAQLLRTSADVAEEKASPRLQNRNRFDIRMLRTAADALDSPKPSWKPIVIEGGLSDRDGRD